MLAPLIRTRQRRATRASEYRVNANVSRARRPRRARSWSPRWRRRCWRSPGGDADGTITWMTGREDAARAHRAAHQRGGGGGRPPDAARRRRPADRRHRARSPRRASRPGAASRSTARCRRIARCSTARARRARPTSRSSATRAPSARALARLREAGTTDFLAVAVSRVEGDARRVRAHAQLRGHDGPAVLARGHRLGPGRGLGRPVSRP